jgi:hypothetical protein
MWQRLWRAEVDGTRDIVASQQQFCGRHQVR